MIPKPFMDLRSAMPRRVIYVAALLLIFQVNAHAYLDPGTGSMILQVVLGGILAAVMTAKIWWSRLKGLFVRSSNKEKTGDNDE